MGIANCGLTTPDPNNPQSPIPNSQSFWGRWGILTYDGQPKPIYYALKAYLTRPTDPMPVNLISGPTDGSLGMMAFGSPDKATLFLWYTGGDESRVKVALPQQFDNSAFDVALFDRDNNNPAAGRSEQTSSAGPPVLSPQSSVLSAGDLLFALKPNSLVIMTTRNQK